LSFAFALDVYSWRRDRVRFARECVTDLTDNFRMPVQGQREG
jgi:hypothetical protein